MKALEMAGPGISERVLRPMVVDWNNGRAGEWVGLLAVVPMCADGDGDDDDGSSWSGREGSAEFGGNPSEMREIVCVYNIIYDSIEKYTKRAVRKVSTPMYSQQQCAAQYSNPHTLINPPNKLNPRENTTLTKTEQNKTPQKVTPKTRLENNYARTIQITFASDSS